MIKTLMFWLKLHIIINNLINLLTIFTTDVIFAIKVKSFENANKALNQSLHEFLVTWQGTEHDGMELLRIK